MLVSSRFLLPEPFQGGPDEETIRHVLQPGLRFRIPFIKPGDQFVEFIVLMLLGHAWVG